MTPTRLLPSRLVLPARPGVSSYDQKLEAKDGGLPHVVPTRPGLLPHAPRGRCSVLTSQRRL